jgi:hypothetical protein
MRHSDSPAAEVQPARDGGAILRPRCPGARAAGIALLALLAATPPSIGRASPGGAAPPGATSDAARASRIDADAKTSANEADPGDRIAHAVPLLASPSATDDPSNPAARVRREVEARLALFESEIGRLEAGRDRTRLFARKLTVDTLLAVATLPRSLAFGPAPDPLPLWRYDFRGVARPLRPRCASTDDDGDLGFDPLGGGLSNRPASAAPQQLPALWDELGRGPTEALHARFTVRMRTLVDGDDPATLGGLVLIEPQRTLLLATWCEPCLAPIAVDFPVVPEAFLLEWDAQRRSIAVARPRLDGHSERVRPEPPDLDQPEDLYDLFDGVRPLPWLERSAPRSGGGIDHREHAVTILEWESRDDAGRLLQRVSWRSAAARPRHRGGDRDDAGVPVPSGSSPPRLVVEQPPLSTRWRSGHRYELAGDAAGTAMPRRTLRPEGELLQHAEGATAIFEIVPGEDGAWCVEGTIRRGDAIAAEIRLDRFARIDLDESASVAGRWRSAFEADGATARPQVDWRHLDPTARTLHAERTALLTALRIGDPVALDGAARRWSDAARELGVDPDSRLRALEGVAESLAAALDQSRVDLLFDGPWALEAAALDGPTRLRLSADRIRQGRFGAALRLLDGVDLADAPAAAAAPGDQPLDTAWLRRRLVAVALRPPEQRTRPEWIEPPGRAALDRQLAGGPPMATAADSSEIEGDRASAGSAGAASAAAEGPLEHRGAEQFEAWVGEGFEAAIEASPALRRELRELLHAVLHEQGHAPRPTEARGSHPSAGDPAHPPIAPPGSASADAPQAPLRPSDLAAWLASPQWRSQVAGLDRAIDPRRVEASLRLFRERLAAALAAPPPADPRRVLAEEALLLEAMLAAADRIGRPLPPPTREALTELLRAHSERRCMERLNPFFAATPAAAPDALRLHSEAQQRLDRDPALLMIADRLAMEQRLADADPATARFRSALIEANLELVADRIAAIVADALWIQTEALGIDRPADAALDPTGGGGEPHPRSEGPGADGSTQAAAAHAGSLPTAPAPAASAPTPPNGSRAASSGSEPIETFEQLVASLLEGLSARSRPDPQQPPG